MNKKKLERNRKAADLLRSVDSTQLTAVSGGTVITPHLCLTCGFGTSLPPVVKLQ